MPRRNKRCLNAPFGARCFLTAPAGVYRLVVDGLNAPFGARCFLTSGLGTGVRNGIVLMHLLVLGAF